MTSFLMKNTQQQKVWGRTEVAQIGRLRKNLLNVMDTIPD
jgi:hypothetical protein